MKGMEMHMNGFVDFTLVVSMLIYTALAVSLIVVCKNLISGVLVTIAAIHNVLLFLSILKKHNKKPMHPLFFLK